MSSAKKHNTKHSSKDKEVHEKLIQETLNDIDLGKAKIQKIIEKQEMKKINKMNMEFGSSVRENNRKSEKIKREGSSKSSSVVI